MLVRHIHLFKYFSKRASIILRWLNFFINVFLCVLVHLFLEWLSCLCIVSSLIFRRLLVCWFIFLSWMIFLFCIFQDIETSYWFEFVVLPLFVVFQLFNEIEIKFFQKRKKSFLSICNMLVPKNIGIQRRNHQNDVPQNQSNNTGKWVKLTISNL